MTRRRALAWALVGLGIGFVIVAALSVPVILGQIRITQVDNTQRAEQDSEALLIIKDCTQPAGKCFKRGQRATAKAVGDINQVVILAAACAPLTPGDVDAITACIVDGLAKP